MEINIITNEIDQENQMKSFYKFKEWLSKFVDVDLPIGDLARDVRDSGDIAKAIVEWKDFPNTVSYIKMMKYLKYEKNASGEVIDVFQDAYFFYCLSNGLFISNKDEVLKEMSKHLKFK